MKAVKAMVERRRLVVYLNLIILVVLVFSLQAPMAFAAYSNDQLIPAVNPTNVANNLS
ncbi:hypothetical protein Tph_c14070 [Thermacetogenium phaeum DSM 12270]|uniref:Uncharacterized protein n=1 Tax=Thermacetogenium phaeum (strain ATCC BAA-254 / DSM 26808 / PB) TaxID=1089553 RepID=K4LHS2_THEPS|nr:hypothetical protein Tph_c14070 [Thermacetogenium phaeum DSM 12270]